MKRCVSPAVFPGRPILFGMGVMVPIGRSPIVAHQGGWDEILLVIAPLAVIGGLLWLANRRVEAQLQEEEAAAEEAATSEEDVVETGTEARSGDDGQD